MIIERVHSPGISHYSYFIGSGDSAAVIDPRRDTGAYLDLATRLGLSITHIFETHRNEDYVVGSTELAALTGARILHGHRFPFSYGEPVREGDLFAFGPVTLSVLETPGHTFESISLVLRDSAVSDAPIMVFTGDALFAGDTGRTDFYGAARTDEVSGLLYDSIHTKILPLGDGVILAPAHGAGSVCGTAISDHPVTTVGYEKQTNPSLQLGRDEFIARKKAAHHYYPPYFRKMEEYNARGTPLPGKMPVLNAVTPQALALSRDSVQLVDIRSPTSFASGHIPGSLSIWRDGIPSFAGWFLDYDRPIILIDDWNPASDETVHYLVRLGYDNIGGFLSGGFPAWSRAGLPAGQIGAWSVHDLARHRDDSDLVILDVRDQVNRLHAGAIENSVPVYIGDLPERAADLEKDRHIACICDAGFKGSIAASLLARAGFPRVTNVLGGMTGWLKAGYPVIHPDE